MMQELFSNTIRVAEATDLSFVRSVYRILLYDAPNEGSGNGHDGDLSLLAILVRNRHCWFGNNFQCCAWWNERNHHRASDAVLGESFRYLSSLLCGYVVSWILQRESWSSPG